MINLCHVFERQIDRPSTGIDQDVVVHAKAGSTQQGAANATRAAEYSYFHGRNKNSIFMPDNSNTSRSFKG